MKIGKRIMYDTMNSWNGQKSLAYNLKIYNVIRADLRNKAYVIMADENLSCEIYNGINALIDNFTDDCKGAYTAGFNGRSGGYLVLYKSCRIVYHNQDGTCIKRLETSMTGLDETSVPSEIKKKFRKLAQDIVNYAEWFLENFDIVEREIVVKKKIKVLRAKGE